MELVPENKSPGPQKSYQKYVRAQSTYNPCLRNLELFLSSHATSQSKCRVVALDFREGIKGLSARTKVKLQDLSSKLQDDGDLRHPLQGRILIIEDLSKDIVELLGSELDIDPLFFSMHLHRSQAKEQKGQSSSEAILPSRIMKKEYINISYHRSVTTDHIYDVRRRYMRDTVVGRKIVFLAGTNIGLAQHCASVLLKKQNSSFWIGK